MQYNKLHALYWQKDRMKKIFTIIRKIPRDHIGLAVLFILLAGSGGFFLYDANQKIRTLAERADLLEQKLALTSSVLERSIADTHASLAEELNKDRQSVSAIKNDLGNFRGKVDTISGTVSTLEKLSKTDPELLQKYSKVFFLNENYAPERLAAIDKKYLYYETRPESVHASVMPELKNLLNAASSAGVTLYVRSAYRSFDEQESLKSAYSITYGTGANAFSADQGYSEHQLGTTIDFITTGLNGQLEGFETTVAYQWLLANAYKYGFILSYPENNQYYIFEPWHWRYVGVPLATYLHAQNKLFYDLDQRELDTYLVSLFEN